MSAHLLLVEDDAALAEMVREYLVSEDFRVTVERDGATAIERIRHDAFDAIILDIGLPGADGFTVCRSVRDGFDGPIIVLTARGGEIDEVVAIEVGADDFMSKPVRPRALLARLKSHLRRSEGHTSGVETPDATDWVIDDMVVHRHRRSVTLGDRDIDLTTAEYDLLEYLAARAGSVVDRKQIYLDLLEIPYDGLDRSIDLRISRLRRKLGDDPNQPERIKSIRGVGYMLVK